MPDASADRLRRLALTLPAQFRDGFRAGLNLPELREGDLSRVVVAGLGGSAIAGDLATVLTEPEASVALTVVRGPELPRSLRRTDLVVAASYSGETSETLAAFASAGRRGVRRLVLTSGGPLAASARVAKVPVVMVPPGGPPRAWVGFAFGALLGVLDPAFPRTNVARVEGAVRGLERTIGSFASPRGSPARWAAQLGERRAVVYADSPFDGLARRWKSQLEENAKRPAEFGLFPEIFHNTLVAWDAAGPAEGRERGIVDLLWSGASPVERARHRYLARLLRERQIPVAEVRLRPRDRLAAVLTGIALGDFFSLAVARRTGVDPYPIDAIDRMKDALGGTARPVPKAAARRHQRSAMPSRRAAPMPRKGLSYRRTPPDSGAEVA